MLKMNLKESQNESPEAYSQRVLEILSDPDIPEGEKRILMAVVDNINVKPKTTKMQITREDEPTPITREERTSSQTVEPQVQQVLSGTRARLPVPDNETMEASEHLSGKQVAQAWNDASAQLKELKPEDKRYFGDLLIELLKQMGCKEEDVTSSERTIIVRTSPSKEELEKRGKVYYILPKCFRSPGGMGIAAAFYAKNDSISTRNDSQAVEFTMEHPSYILVRDDGEEVTEKSLPRMVNYALKGILRKK